MIKLKFKLEKNYMKRFLMTTVLMALFSAGCMFSQSVEGAVLQVKGNIIENLEGNFSATFQSSSVAEVFRIIAQETGLNIMLSPKANQTVTAKFKNVLIKDAFLAILSANDLYYIEQGNIVKVMTLPEYKNELLRKYVQTRTYDASIIDIKNLSAVIKPLLTPSIGDFSVDSQSSKIIVTDIKDNFSRIDLLFKDLASLPKMVELETKILQVTLEDGNDMGINWSALNLGKAVDIKLDLIPTGGVGDSHINISGGYTDPVSGINVNTLISALSTKYKTRLVSQPKILAMNREKALILIGDKVPYVKTVTENDVTARQTSTVDFIDTGVKLEVEPLITPDDEVKLNIKAELSSSKSVPITTTENAPQITTTEVSCNSVAMNNQSIIIGGLIKRNITKNVKAVPFLGYIPLLGFLFSYTSEDITREEIVIIITPRVIRGGTSNLSFLKTSDDMTEEIQTAITNGEITTNQVKKQLQDPDIIQPASVTNDASGFKR